MDTIQKKISSLIPSQFPDVYKEYGPTYIEFVKKYYEWMESDDQALYHIRRFFEYKDVDETTEELLIQFKETYLKNIQLDTVQNTRLLIKHSLDLYRSKGTERSIQLLFRILYGIDAKIYYPRKDLFKTSDGQYKIPQYIEVISDENNFLYEGKQITGEFSGATAFVESVIRKKIFSKIIDVFFLSNIKGTFIVGEPLSYTSATIQSFVSGSVVSFNVDENGIGSGFAIGDTVSFRSNTGSSGLARVANVVSTTGKVSFELIDGGYGYTNSSIILISDKIITVDSFTNTPQIFEVVTQAAANLHYVNSNGDFNVSDTITTYHANGDVKGECIVLSANTVNTTSGYLFVSIVSGNVNDNAIYSTANAIGANLSIIDGYTDKTANGTIAKVINSTAIGVMDITNQFYVNAAITTSTNLANGSITALSEGSGANIEFSNNMLYTETIALNNDLLSTYANVQLNATTYGFPANTSANIEFEISVALTYVNTVFGKIQTIITLNEGTDYNQVPSITIYEPLSIPFNRKNLILAVDGASDLFTVGEVVTQTATNARGYVLSANSSDIRIQNLRLLSENQFVVTTNSTTIIESSESSVTANITSITVNNASIEAGLNANISVEVFTANGAINELSLISSGYGYNSNDSVGIYNSSNVYVDDVTVNIGPIGKSQGLYKRKGGFLSDQKKLFDGHYYQEFSYDIISSVETNLYKDTLKNINHPAGYALFGTIEHKAINNTQSNSIVSYVTQA